MISSELIDYVKAQLAAGATREKITTDLLGQGGWTQAQVNEAFLAADQKMPTLQSPEADPKLTQVPTSIKYFEWLMYASLLGNTAIWLFEFATNVLQTNLTMIYAVPVISILIKLLLVYLVVYRRVNGARSALTILVMLGLFGATGLILTAISNPLLLIAALPSIFEIAAIYFVFKKDSNAWLTKTQTITVQDDTGNVVKVLAAPEAKKGNIWNKTIPRTNKTSLIVASTFFIFSVFVFGGGLSVFNDSTLGVFAHMMLVTMIVFAGFVLLENFVFRK